MKAEGKVMVCPGGERIVIDEDEVRVQAEALRLGVLGQVSEAIRNGSGQRGASVLTRDGDRLVAIIRWAGFAKASNNGWASMSVTPASEKTAGWLMSAVNLLIDGDAMGLVPAEASWRN